MTVCFTLVIVIYIDNIRLDNDKPEKRLLQGLFQGYLL